MKRVCVPRSRALPLLNSLPLQPSLLSSLSLPLSLPPSPAVLCPSLFPSPRYVPRVRQCAASNYPLALVPVPCAPLPLQRASGAHRNRRQNVLM
eukprot:768721-Rhodomonas_salina.1